MYHVLTLSPSTHTNIDTTNILNDLCLTTVCVSGQGLTGFPGAAGRVGAAGPSVSMDFAFTNKLPFSNNLKHTN